MEHESAADFQRMHLAVWNERDRQKRDGMMTAIYADDILMYDKDFVLKGSREISDFIDKVQADPMFDFIAARPVERIQNGARLFWHIKTGEGLLTGMDFFIMNEGRAASIHVFVDAAMQGGEI